MPRISTTGGSPFSFGFLRVRQRVNPLLRGHAIGQRGDDDLRRLGRALLGLRTGLAKLLEDSEVRVRRTGSFRVPTDGAAVSSAPLGLGGATRARLASSEEVNTASTSFGPSEPAFQGGSTSPVTIGGTYDGSLGDETLTFRVRVGGRVGTRNAQIEVLDSSGQKLGQFRVDRRLPPGEPIEIFYGLTASFGPGTLQVGDSFELQLSATQGTNVDPLLPFDGTGGSVPGFDPGYSVGAGSFEINGTTIAVAANDTIQSVLDRITSSSAGVTATFDAANDRVLLAQKTPGAVPTIALGADDSGFLAAVKLAGATVTPGADDERTSPLERVGAFSSVVAGSFLVNEARVSVDPATDSLTDLLDRIEAVAPGVQASFDLTTGRVTLSPSAGEQLVIGNDTSGFLDSIGIAPGTYGGEIRRGRTVKRLADEKDLRKGLLELARTFSSLSASRVVGPAGRLTADVLKALDGAARGALDELGREAPASGALRSGFGIDVSVPGSDLLTIDPSKLKNALRNRVDELSRFLQGDPNEQDDGLLGRLDQALETIQEHLALYLDPVQDAGLLLDIEG